MPLPTFWKTIEERYKAKLSHLFLLYNNINDLIYDDVYGYLNTRDYLMERMSYLGCDAVLYYTRSEGLLFPNVGLRDAQQNAFRLARIEEIEPLPDPPEEMDVYPTKNINAGLRHVGEERKIVAPQEMMSVIEGFFGQLMGNLRVGFLVCDVEKLLPNQKTVPMTDQKIIDIEIWQKWASDFQMRTRGHIILLLTENPSNVTNELLLDDRSQVFPVNIAIPTYQERLAFIKHLLYIPELEGEEGKYKLGLPERMLSEDFAALTHGLNLIDIMNLWIISKSRDNIVSPAMVVQQNRESIRKRSYGRLELIYGDHGVEFVGGLGNVVNYMGNVINALKNWDIKSVPKGILMVGPPGTGKTNLIYALGRNMGVHIVRLTGLRGTDPLAHGQWDLHRAFDIIRSLTPVIAFIDDIDKLVYTGTDENERRLMDQLMSDLLRFMSDPTLYGKVLWIAASNRPDLINPEFRKQGRLDDVIPFLLPNISEREDILRKIFPRNAIPYDQNINFANIASRTERCTGGDLELIIMRSFQNAHLNNRDMVVEQDLIKASDEFVHPRDPSMDEYLMLLALRESSLSPLIPSPLPVTLQEKVTENNKLNKTKINQRIRELEMQLNIQGRR
jgi:transitional endoplasmic reticulum ATPase